jgi:hypothetical protein
VTRRSRRADAPLLVWRDGDVWRWSIRLPESDHGRSALRGAVAHPTWKEARHAATTAFPELAVHVDRGSRLARLAHWTAGHLVALVLVLAVVLAAASRLRSRPPR